MELSTGLVAARPWACVAQTNTITLLLSHFLSVMEGWAAPSVHAADSYRSGGGQGAARTLPERRLCCMCAVGIIWGRMFTDKGSRTGLRDRDQVGYTSPC